MVKLPKQLMKSLPKTIEESKTINVMEEMYKLVIEYVKEMEKCFEDKPSVSIIDKKEEWIQEKFKIKEYSNCSSDIKCIVETVKLKDCKWSMYNDKGELLQPYKWIGGGQEKNISEIVNSMKGDKQEITSYISTCGSGKSATMLHSIMNIGRGIVVVPSKILQRQYKDDYYEKGSKYLIKEDGTKLKIGMVIGRSNFKCKYIEEYIKNKDSMTSDGMVLFGDEIIYCDNRYLPCTRKLIGKESRISVGCKCKWFIPSPLDSEIIDGWNEELIKEEDGEEIEITKLEYYKDKLCCDDISYYTSINNRKYGLFVRDDAESVCPYYKQFYNYVDSDVIVFNKSKWEWESKIGRKPKVDIECIDEADEFLIGLNNSVTISRSMVNRLYETRSENKTSDENMLENKKKELLESFDFKYSKLKRAKDKYNNHDFGLLDDISEFIEYIKKISNNGNEDDLDNEVNELLNKINIIREYGNKISVNVKENRKNKDVPTILYSIPYPEIILRRLLKGCCNRIMFFSATMLNINTLKYLYGIEFSNMIKGREDQPGELRILKPQQYRECKKCGKRFSSDYNGKCDKCGVDVYSGVHDRMQEVINSRWKSKDNGEKFREDYSKNLLYIITKLNEIGNTLIISPRKYVEKSIDYLKQNNYKIVVDYQGKGEYYENLKGKGNLITISWRYKRGFDGRDDKCRVIVPSKYPYPNIGDAYYKALIFRFEKEGIDISNTFLDDIAKVELIQTICRGLRHDKDYCYFSSPDIKVYTSVVRWWNEQLKIKESLRRN